jgi:transposase
MLGPAKRRDLNRSVAVSLECLVPPDHFYRHLDAVLDLSFVRQWVADLYAPIGRPSIDPEVFFCFQLLAFFEGIRSERKLVEMADLNLAYRWYLGYNLDEPLPERSSLIKIRQRLGLDLFRRFFEHVLDLCDNAGLIWGKEVLVDATKVPGYASMDSLVPRLKEVVDDHLVELFGDGQESVDSHQDDVESMRESTNGAPRRLHPEGSTAEAENAPKRWDLLEHCRLDPDRPAPSSYERVSSRKISLTDPDATPMAMRDGRTVLGYQDHYLVDGGKARIILHCLVTPGEVMENQPFLDQFRRTLFRRKLHPKRVIADTAYGTVDIIGAIEGAGIRMYTPLPDWDRPYSYFPTSRFTYDVEQDVYHCPQGETLRLRWTDEKRELKQYRARPAACRDCPLRAECTSSKQGRIVYRSCHAELLDRVRGYHDTPAFEKAMWKRSIWLEGLFAEAKQWHGLQKFRVRGLTNVNIQGLLIAAGQNLKRWFQATGWGRKSFPGAAIAPVMALRAAKTPS